MIGLTLRRGGQDPGDARFPRLAGDGQHIGLFQLPRVLGGEDRSGLLGGGGRLLLGEGLGLETGGGGQFVKLEP